MKENKKVKDRLKVIRGEKGITLVALSIYIISLLITLAILSTVTTYFYSNFQRINERTTDITEFDRFNLYFLGEVKKSGNSIKSSVANSTSIEFTNGNKYEFVNKAIYLKNADKTIKIADKIEVCKFTTRTENGKTIINVRISVAGVLKEVEYVIA